MLVRFGDACRQFLDDELQFLTLKHCQLDEIWTFVQKKQARLTVEEKATRHDIGDVYLWVAFDEATKLIPTFAIGKRSADMARKLLVDLRNRLVIPKPHASDDHAYQLGSYQPVTQISTDGFAAYPEAVDLAFGPHVKYGTLIKEYRNARQQYDPSEMIGTKRKAVKGEVDEWSICTSHVERNNLTIRHFLKQFCRLSLGFSKKLDNLASAVALHFAYFNFCWRPREKGTSGRLRPTPAQCANVTKRQWTVEELYREVVGRYL